MASLRKIFLILATVSICKPLSSCPSNTIRIVITDDSHKMKVNPTALQVFLRPEIQNIKIVILAIAGEMRAAKSYVMTYPIRYLKENGAVNKQWMGDSTTTATDGFYWRKGKDPETIGINLLREPFIIKDSNGEKVAVFVMDTQGLFDFNTTLVNNAKIFAYALLGSSQLILNFRGRINENDLHNLQLSVDFAKMASSIDNSIYQPPKAMVLIQNWDYDDEISYGLQGGREYIEHVLAHREGKSDAVRQNIATSFNGIECYLMPNPGTNVTKKSFVGANGDLDPQYFDHVRAFSEHLFNPKHLAIKQWEGRAMTAKEYYDFLISIDQALQSDEMPKLEDMAKAFARVHFSGVRDQCMKSYVEEIQDNVIHGKVIADERLKELHEAAKDDAIKCFAIKSSINIGSATLRNEYGKRLEDDIDGHYQRVKKDMDALKQKRARIIGDRMLEEYRKKLDEASTRNPTNLHLLETTHSNTRQDVRESFEKDAKDCSPYVATYRSQLLRNIDDHYGREKRVTQERIAAERKQQQIKFEKAEAERKVIEERKNAKEALIKAKEAVRKREEAERKAEVERENAQREKKRAQDAERDSKKKRKKEKKKKRREKSLKLLSC